MIEAIKKIIAILESKVSLLKGVDLSTQQNVNWYPVLEMPNSKIGICDLYEWVTVSKNGLIVLNDERSFIFLISLLELTKSEVTTMLLKASNKVSSELNFVAIFPFYEIIKAGFEQCSDYWSELAFKWYAELDESEKLRFINTFQEVSEAKWASQKVRQLAKKELKILTK